MTETTTLRKFLLDDLDEQRREAVEELMFSDDEVFQRLTVLDDDLVEAYVRGELSTADSQRLFRRLNASDRGRRTLDFMVQIADRAKARAEHATEAEFVPVPVVDPRPSFMDELRRLFFGFSAAPRAAMAMCALVLAAIALPIVQMESMDERLRSLDSERAALAGQLETLEASDQGLAPVQTTFSLHPLVRAEGASEPNLRIAPETEVLELWLDPGGLVTYPDFRVRLRTQSEDLWKADGLSSRQHPARGLFVPVYIPTEALPKGRYDVILDGRAEDRYHEVARYPITVERLP